MTVMNSVPDPAGFDPVHKAHAIEQVMFVLRFEGEADGSALAEADKTLIGDPGLPGKNEIMGLSIQLGMALPPPPTMRRPTPHGYNHFHTRSDVLPMLTNESRQWPHGYNHFHSRPDGLVDIELTVDRSSLVFRTLNYDRWAENWKQAKKYIAKFLPAYTQTAKLAAIGLNYSDKFVWKGAPETCDAAYVLRKGSDYVSPRIFTAPDLWHSHSGAFGKEEGNTKRLTTVNLDMLDEPTPEGNRRALAITSVLTDMFNQPGYEPLRLAPDNTLAFIDQRMQELHALDKKILGSILTENMVKRIALFGG